MQTRKRQGYRFTVSSLSLPPLRGPLVRVVVEEPLDEVDVGHEHAAAAVALQAQRVEGVAFKRWCRGFEGLDRRE
jgi:hypothetical protein